MLVKDLIKELNQLVKDCPDNANLKVVVSEDSAYDDCSLVEDIDVGCLVEPTSKSNEFFTKDGMFWKKHKVNAVRINAFSRTYHLW